MILLLENDFSFKTLDYWLKKCKKWFFMNIVNLFFQESIRHSNTTTTTIYIFNEFCTISLEQVYHQDLKTFSFIFFRFSASNLSSGLNLLYWRDGEEVMERLQGPIHKRLQVPSSLTHEDVQQQSEKIRR